MRPDRDFNSRSVIRNNCACLLIHFQSLSQSSSTLVQIQNGSKRQQRFRVNVGIDLVPCDKDARGSRGRLRGYSQSYSVALEVTRASAHLKGGLGQRSIARANEHLIVELLVQRKRQIAIAGGNARRGARDGHRR